MMITKHTTPAANERAYGVAAALSVTARGFRLSALA